jgi:hypothetical protein
MVRTIAINITMVYAWLCARSSQIHDLLLAELLKTRFVHILLYLVPDCVHAHHRFTTCCLLNCWRRVSSTYYSIWYDVSVMHRTTKKNNVTEGRSPPSLDDFHRSVERVGHVSNAGRRTTVTKHQQSRQTVRKHHNLLGGVPRDTKCKDLRIRGSFT